MDTSKTHRLYLLLKEQIASGMLAPGDQLPSEPALAQTHGLSRVTVRRALEGLVEDGLIVRRAKTGTFVRHASQPPVMVANLTNTLSHLIAMGKATDVRLLSFDYAPASPTIALALGLEAGDVTQVAVRVRALDGKPFSYLTTHVPEAIGRRFDKTDLQSTPLLSLLERAGVVASRAEQTLSATLAGPEIAEALAVDIGAPLIALTRIVYGDNGAGVEHLSALYRPDVHVFQMALVRERGAGGLWRSVDAETSVSSRSRASRRQAPSPARRNDRPTRNVARSGGTA